MEKILKEIPAKLIPAKIVTTFAAKDGREFSTENEALNHESYLDMEIKSKYLKKISLDVYDSQECVFLRDEEDLITLLWSRGISFSEIRKDHRSLHNPQFNTNFALSKIKYPLWVISRYSSGGDCADTYELISAEEFFEEVRDFLRIAEKTEREGRGDYVKANM